MTEIEFRGLCVNGTNWYHGNLSILKKKFGHVDAGYYISNAAGAPFAYQVRPETVGMFTGKNDCCGNKIYDGDIVEFDPSEWGDDKTNKFLVRWDGEEAAWNFGGGSISDMEWRTVIGNKHDDPILLSQVNNR